MGISSEWGAFASRRGGQNELADTDRNDLDVLRLHRPLDGTGLEEGRKPLFFYPSERPSGAWMLNTFEAGPLYAPSSRAGDWRLGVEPLLDAGGLELTQSSCNGLAIRRNSSQSVAIGAIGAIKQ
jgi:hypothetical protein